MTSRRFIAAAALALAAAASAAAPPFNATAKAYSWLFGAAPPVGAISEHTWLWYRGANTTAKALLVHAPGGPAGFTIEIISPQDDEPSIYNELLGKQGASFFP